METLDKSMHADLHLMSSIKTTLQFIQKHIRCYRNGLDLYVCRITPQKACAKKL